MPRPLAAMFFDESNKKIFLTNFPLVIPYQDCSSRLDSSKNMAARGRGLFSLYI